MNRAERRKSGIKKSVKTYTLNDSQIKQIKDDAVKEAIDTAFIYMLGLPVMIIHDKYPQLMKKECDCDYKTWVSYKCVDKNFYLNS